MKIKIYILLVVVLSCHSLVQDQSFNSAVLFNNSKKAVFEIITYDKGGNELSYGTGFFIDSSGIGVTNYHVLKDAYYATIRTYDESTFNLKEILYADEDYDFVKFTIDHNGEMFKYLILSKAPINTGDDVFVIGNPIGLEYTISNGIVSAIRQRNVNGKFISLIQNTASISHGSSGSPLIGKSGKVFGIISFTYSEGQNLNFGISFKEIANKSSDGYLDLPLDKATRLLKVDRYEMDLIANEGAFTPKDAIAVFIGQDKEVIKTAFRDWQVVQNTDFYYGLSDDNLGVYNFYFYEKQNTCDGESYNIYKGKETSDFVQELLDAGYKKAKVKDETNGYQSFFTEYYVVSFQSDERWPDKNFVTISWNPNYHPNFKRREYKLK